MPDLGDQPEEHWLEDPPALGSDDTSWRGEGAHPALPPGALYTPEYQMWHEQQEKDEALRRLMGDAIVSDDDEEC